MEQVEVPAEYWQAEEEGEACDEGDRASERKSIRAWCQAQDIAEVLGRYTVLDCRGVGRCPQQLAQLDALIAHLQQRVQALLSDNLSYAIASRRGKEMSKVTHLNTDKQPECIIVSNRSPVEYDIKQDGSYQLHFSAGGVVTGLLGAIGQRKVIWIALSSSEAQRNENTDQLIAAAPKNVILRLVRVPPKMYRRYYVNISNRILWFAQHTMLETANGVRFDYRTRLDWEEGYSTVNSVLANAVIAELRQHAFPIPVLFQDYHLYLTAEIVRAHFSGVRTIHTSYIPWPDPRYFSLLPTYMSYAIYRGLTANDVLGFQTIRDLKNFYMGAEYFLKDARFDWNSSSIPQGRIYQQGHSTTLRLYPVALSRSYTYQQATSKEALEALEELKTFVRFDGSQKILMRVDRIDPTKNIVRGFEAYEYLLQTHPELLGAVTFLALLVPARQSIAEYRAYEHQVRRIIQRINNRYGQQNWQPIVALFGNDRARALACLQYYDVLLVNPVIDGMNLVVKEGGLLNKRNGVIVLSHTAGVHDTVGNYTMSIAPIDIESTASALYKALSMPTEQRAVFARAVREALLKEDADLLMDMQLADLRMGLALEEDT